MRKFFNEEAKQSAVEMVHDIRAEFDFILHNIDWMDDLTKSRYVKFLPSIRIIASIT